MKNLKRLKKAELIEHIQKLKEEQEEHRAKYIRYIQSLEEEKAEINNAIVDLTDKIQDLNIRCKYAEFDSEAGQREIDYLKKLLKDKNK